LAIQWNTNYVNTKALTNLALEGKLLKQDGKVIFTSSQLGKYSFIKESNPSVYEKFCNYKTMAMSELDELAATTWAQHTSGNPEERQLWNSAIYHTTKMFLSTYAYILGREAGNLYSYPNLQVYHFHPGWCRTDMTKHYEEKGIIPPMSQEQGAETALYLATDPAFTAKNEHQGEYFNLCAHESIIG
jgi:NAD(P)-dependent dehydrogenase (short-subunit alcohol dehydrogenase family)